jgi:3-oxoacyl-[acyl-carrier-protein] synthase-3
MSFNKVKIKGTGIYAPKKILTNFDLEKIVETSDQWIFERTGIKERKICSTEGGEWPTDMAKHATLQALEKANMSVDDIDLIIFATLTADAKLPNAASILQTKLGMTNKCGCFDLAAACTGFVYGINMATAMIKTGASKNVLVVGAEMLSREVNWKDRNMCILFGDGCGVAILGQADEGEDCDILATTLSADGTGREYFDQPVGGSVEPLRPDHLENDEQYMRMKGKEMFKVATRTLASNAKKVIEDAGLSLQDVDWLVPHQANVRIIETTGKLLGIPNEKVIINIEKWGNTSAATVPIAFHEAIEEGKIKRGDLVLFDAFGAGLTSGATLLRY